jgi:hypothetical protein
VSSTAATLATVATASHQEPISAAPPAASATTSSGRAGPGRRTSPAAAAVSTPNPAVVTVHSVITMATRTTLASAPASRREPAVGACQPGRSRRRSGPRVVDRCRSDARRVVMTSSILIVPLRVLSNASR